MLSDTKLFKSTMAGLCTTVSVQQGVITYAKLLVTIQKKKSNYAFKGKNSIQHGYATITGIVFHFFQKYLRSKTNRVFEWL